MADLDARRARQRAYRAANREAINQKKAEYRAAHREELRAAARLYGINNKERRAEYSAAYRARPEYAEAQAARVSAWKAAHRERVYEYEQTRRARKAGVEREHIDFGLVWERDGGICRICGQAADRNSWHLDHIIPLAAGGAHTYANVAVSHPLCNQSKGALDPRVVGSPYAFLLSGL